MHLEDTCVVCNKHIPFYIGVTELEFVHIVIILTLGKKKPTNIK